MNIKVLFIIVTSIFMFNNFCYAASSENTPLHQAIQSRNYAAVEAALVTDQYLESKGEMERTPLFLAVDSGELEIIDLLLSKKANPRACDQFDRSVFHQALFKIHNSGNRENNIKVVKKLLEYDSRLAHFEGRSIGTGRFFNIPLAFALYKGDLELFTLLLEYEKKQFDNENNIEMSIIPQKYTLVIIGNGCEAHSSNAPQNVIPITKKTVEELMGKIKKFSEKMETNESSQNLLICAALHVFMTQIQEALKIRPEPISIVGYDQCLIWMTEVAVYSSNAKDAEEKK